MYHPVQQMEEPLSRRGELSSHQRSMTLDLDNSDLSQYVAIRPTRRARSLLRTPTMPLLRTPKFEQLLLDLNAPETPTMPTMVFLLTEEKQRHSRSVNRLPEQNLPQQQQTQQQPPPVVQQHFTVGANVSDSSSPMTNPSFSLPSLAERSAMNDYVKGMALMVLALNTTPPSWYIRSNKNSGRESSIQQTTIQQEIQQQLKCEEFSSRKQTMLWTCTTLHGPNI
ncbi:hypothetical protein MRX96_044099 [Rhipicephalus microplus]